MFVKGAVGDGTAVDTVMVGTPVLVSDGDVAVSVPCGSANTYGVTTAVIIARKTCQRYMMNHQ